MKPMATRSAPMDIVRHQQLREEHIAATREVTAPAIKSCAVPASQSAIIEHQAARRMRYQELAALYPIEVDYTASHADYIDIPAVYRCKARAMRSQADLDRLLTYTRKAAHVVSAA